MKLLLGFNALTFIIFIADAVYYNSCNDTILMTKDLEITCLNHKIYIYCKNLTDWTINIPRNLTFGTNSSTELHVIKCNFPEDFRFSNISKFLNIDITRLQIEEPQNFITKTHFQNLINLQKLYLENGNYENISQDLFYHVPGLIKIYIGKTRNLYRIPDGLFSNLQNLSKLEIDENDLRVIQSNCFAGLINLERLIIRKNVNLSKIESGAFDGLISLKYLDLFQNSIQLLPPGTFKDLSNLSKLYIEQNSPIEISKDLLNINDSHLEELHLNHISNLIISEGFFDQLNNLKVIELIGNNLTKLSELIFEHNKKLEKLKLTNNSLEELPERIFSKNNNLKELFLNENKIKNFSYTIIENVKALTTLNLRSNSLKILPKKFLKEFSNVATIDLSYNGLVYIGNESCDVRNTRLVNLKLSHNLLTMVPNKTDEQYPDIFKCIRLKNLDLSYNSISEIFKHWLALDRSLLTFQDGFKNDGVLSAELSPNIRGRQPDLLINLSNNYITSIDMGDFAKRAEEFFDHRIFSKVAKTLMVSVDLRNNPIQCDCNLVEFVKFLAQEYNESSYKVLQIVSEDELKCRNSSYFGGLQISKLQSNTLKCPVETKNINEACFGICSCWNLTAPRFLYIDCSYRNLTQIPSQIGNPLNWNIKLNMSGNKIQSNPSLREGELKNVKILSLSDTSLTEINSDLISDSLEELELHQNFISKIPDHAIDKLKRLKKLTLHDNPWMCDCDSRVLLNFVHNAKRNHLDLDDPENLRCTNDVVLTEISIDDLCRTETITIIILSVSVAIIGTLLALLSAIFYIYHHAIKSWLYSKPRLRFLVSEKEFDRDKTYDAFISFSHNDEDFVMSDLVPVLENGQPPFKLCFHTRDWLAGEYIPDQIARSVTESRRTIVILSANFLDSVWGKEEFRTAHSLAIKDGTPRLIVVLYGDVKIDQDLEPELKNYLKMNTYLKWDDPWFWNKLRLRMPHYKGNIKRNSSTAKIIERNIIALQQPNNSDTIPMNADSQILEPTETNAFLEDTKVDSTIV